MAKRIGMRRCILFILLNLALLVSNGFALDEKVRHTSDARMFPYSQRSVSIIVTKEGYYPDKMSFFEGEQVTFFVTSLGVDPHCMVVANHDLFLSANQGKISEGKVVFENPGVYKFYCPSDSINGSITILPRAEKKLVKLKKLPTKEEMNPTNTTEENGRSISSGPWIPRDF
ncbi:cupredoxin domain-containing protein [Bacteriovoracaceae bacterium]|nr:cupredoxin domain-containing protein [Bacteriovoracaceae bacterium]